jgi:hypothetical protein
VHTVISLIIFYKLRSVTTLKRRESILLENHIHIVALTPDLQRVSFYNVTELFYHSSTTKPMLSLILYKRILSEALSLTPIQKIVISLVATLAGKFTYGCHADQYLANNFGLARSSPARYTRIIFIMDFIYKALGIKAKSG